MEKDDQAPRTIEEAMQAVPEDQRAFFKHGIDAYLKRKITDAQLDDLGVPTKENLYYAIISSSHTSPRLLARIKDDPEYQRILELLVESRDNNLIADELEEIYAENIVRDVERLERKKEEIQRRILGEKLRDYLAVRDSDRPDKKKICERILLRAMEAKGNRSLVERLDEISMYAEGISHRRFFPLTPKMLGGSLGDDPIEVHHAALIHEPIQLCVWEKWEDSWAQFPLKWAASTMPVPLLRDLFDEYSNGDDLSGFFIERYDDEGLNQLIEALGNQFLNPPSYPVLRERRPVVIEALECYEQGKYYATVSLLLAQIEGIVWDYSIFLNRTGTQIYNADESKLIGADTGEEIDNKTIGTLLRFTRMKSSLDEAFIRYFCDELYEERNPILHGRDANFGEKANAASKIGTLEYLVDEIATSVEKRFFEHCDNSLPRELMERFGAAVRNATKES